MKALSHTLQYINSSKLKSEVSIDTQTGMLLGIPRSAICVQRFDDSRNSAIHITYRISLRSSSLREPRYPLLKVVYQFKILISSDSWKAYSEQFQKKICIRCLVLNCVKENVPKQRNVTQFRFHELCGGKKTERAQVLQADTRRFRLKVHRLAKVRTR